MGAKDTWCSGKCGRKRPGCISGGWQNGRQTLHCARPRDYRPGRKSRLARDRAIAPKFGDFVRRVPMFGKNDFGMLPLSRRREGARGLAGAEFESAGQGAIATDTGMVHVRDITLFLYLRKIEHVLDHTYRAARHVFAKNSFPLQCRMFLQGGTKA